MLKSIKFFVNARLIRLFRAERFTLMAAITEIPNYVGFVIAVMLFGTRVDDYHDPFPLIYRITFALAAVLTAVMYAGSVRSKASLFKGKHKLIKSKISFYSTRRMLNEKYTLQTDDTSS